MIEFSSEKQTNFDLFIYYQTVDCDNNLEVNIPLNSGLLQPSMGPSHRWQIKHMNQSGSSLSWLFWAQVSHTLFSHSSHLNNLCPGRMSRAHTLHSSFMMSSLIGVLVITCLNMSSLVWLFDSLLVLCLNWQSVFEQSSEYLHNGEIECRNIHPIFPKGQWSWCKTV